MLIEDCIKERKSVRKYSEKEVSAQLLREVIDLARNSPSWKNTQITRYYVVQNEKIKEDIANNCCMNYDANSRKITSCAALVILTYVKGLSGFESDGSYSTSKGDAWEMFDVGIASQTFSLAAHSKGLGSVILGLFDEEEIYKYINITEGEKIAALITVGYPADTGAKSGPPKKEVDEIAIFIE